VSQQNRVARIAVAAESRSGRSRRLVVTAAAVGVLTSSAGAAALVNGAAFAAPAQDRPDAEVSGKNWQQPVQDIRRSDTAAPPAELSRDLTPAQRLSRVRPSQLSTDPAAVPADGRYARATAEAGK
jgi:hypothetical protein